MAKAEIPSLDDALDAALKAKFAKTDVIVGRASDVGFLSDVQEWVPTGIYWLDLLLSRGQGLPVGRFIEVFGPEEGGKSALSEFLAGLYVRTQASKPHWADLEKSLDWKHFACYGVTRDTLWTPDLETLEQTWDYIGATLDTLDERIAPLAKAKLPPDPPALFVVDSIAAGCPQAELEEETAENKHMAETARAMSKGFRKYLRRVSKSRSTVVFTNQIRDKMNARAGQKQTQPPGGRAMRFGCSTRLELVRVQNLEGKSGRPVGHIVKVTAVKNRHAPSRMTCEFIISYTRGIDVAWSNFLFFKNFGYITPAGASWHWKGRDAAFKRIDFAAFCRDNLAAVEKARDAIFAKELAAYDTAPATDLEDEEEADAPPSGPADEAG